VENQTASEADTTSERTDKLMMIVGRRVLSIRMPRITISRLRMLLFTLQTCLSERAMGRNVVFSNKPSRVASILSIVSAFLNEFLKGILSVTWAKALNLRGVCGFILAHGAVQRFE
jgi:hypothetical protein